MLKALLDIASAYGGYIGVFAVSLVSNSVPFVGVPYLLIVAGYVAREAIRFGLPVEIALVLASALGATLGKLTVYFVAAGFRLRLSESTKDNLKYFTRFSRRMAFPLIVLFAATPMPDDVLYIPLGVARYPLTYYFFGVFVGKAIMVWLASTYFRVIFKYLGEEMVTNPALALCVAALTMHLTVVVMRMNWKRITEVYSERGALSSAGAVLEEFFAVNLRLFKRIISYIPAFHSR